MSDWFSDFTNSDGKQQQALDNIRYLREVAGIVKLISKNGLPVGLEMQLPELTIDLDSVSNGMVDVKQHTGRLRSCLVADPLAILEGMFGNNCPVLELSPLKVRVRTNWATHWTKRVETNRGDIRVWLPHQDISAYSKHPDYVVFLKELGAGE